MKIKKFSWSLILLCAITPFSGNASAITAAAPDKAALTVAIADPTQPDFARNTPPKKTKTVKSKGKRKRKSPIPQLSLQQTLVSNKRKFAVINGRTMTIGKKIRGAKLIRINHNNVVLTYGGKRYTLNLTFPSAIKEVKR